MSVEPSSMPMNGYFASSKIQVVVPGMLKWQHDLVVKAMDVWNTAQVWFQKNFSAQPETYTFQEEPAGRVVVRFTMPPVYENFASWTQYKYQGLSTITGADVYFDSAKTFNPQWSNYCYWWDSEAGFEVGYWEQLVGNCWRKLHEGVLRRSGLCRVQVQGADLRGDVCRPRLRIIFALEAEGCQF